MSKRILTSYVDRGPVELRFSPDGALPLVKDPPGAARIILTLKGLRRHNSLLPGLQPTDRLLLRWGEGGGSGMPNPEAEVRETHYDPLPPDLHQKIDDVVSGSPWEIFIRKWYRTTLTGQQLADEMCISRTQLYADWRAALWYYRGCFEKGAIHD